MKLTPEEERENREILFERLRLWREARLEEYRECELLAYRNKRSRAHVEAMLRRIGLEVFGHDYMCPAEQWRRVKRGW
jgi:hypothetical protein